MLIRLDFGGLKTQDWVHFINLLAGSPPDGALMDHAPATAIRTIHAVQQVCQDAAAAGEEAAPGFIEFELTLTTTVPGGADAALEDYRRAWCWIATRTAGLRRDPRYRQACKPLEQLGECLLHEIAERSHDSDTARALLSGLPPNTLSVRERERIMRLFLKDLKRRGRRGKRELDTNS